MTKSELREIYLKKRKDILPAKHAELSHQITGKFFETTDLEKVLALNCFVSLRHKGEVETQELFERLWKDHPGVKTFAPRINRQTGELESVTISQHTILSENNWRIPEPEGESTDPTSIDLVIVPLLCVDKRGHRVGYGKGFYDRFLAECRPDCVKVGLSFFPPVEEIDDVGEFDISLDRCVTPAEIFRFK